MDKILITRARVGVNGTINADAQTQIRAHLAALEPGSDVVISVRNIGDALACVDEVATWYNNLTEIEFEDPAFLDKLIAKSDELAYYIFRFSADVGEYYRQKNATELSRKNAYNKGMYKARTQIGEGSKFIVSAAEVEVQTEISDYLKAESEADAEYRAAWLLLDSAKNIQDRMSQRISNLKAYRDATLRNGSAHFPNQ